MVSLRPAQLSNEQKVMNDDTLNAFFFREETDKLHPSVGLV